ncbi:hypothetical protein FB451DRAFT_1186368 [Mycena latifolia]|nr:hypothetical protein FB451DRAFT_1186368 [Mycena latifolia]
MAGNNGKYCGNIVTASSRHQQHIHFKTIHDVWPACVQRLDPQDCKRLGHGRPFGPQALSKGLANAFAGPNAPLTFSCSAMTFISAGGEAKQAGQTLLGSQVRWNAMRTEDVGTEITRELCSPVHAIGTPAVDLQCLSYMDQRRAHFGWVFLGFLHSGLSRYFGFLSLFAGLLGNILVSLCSSGQQKGQAGGPTWMATQGAVAPVLFCTICFVLAIEKKTKSTVVSHAGVIQGSNLCMHPISCH